MNAFSDIGLNDQILSAVQDIGFEEPTPIQAKTIPHLLNSDQDLIAFAQTGTGKTAAFGLPAIQLTNIEDKRIQTIVLCPTRELCMQITKDIASFSKNIKGLGVVAVYGGASIGTQIKALSRESQIVVGTPGRVKDLINRKKLLLGNVKRLVLDEADEMLSMGFKEDLNAILAETPKNKQTLLFSATMSKEIIAITKKYMHDSIEISASRMNTGAENVSHYYYMVQARERYEVLKRIADINLNIYGIVFCRTRRETKEIANKLMHDGYNADALHGDLSQAQRDEVMGRFRKRKLQLLVATDVAARGLDVEDISHIINFNLPDDPEIYLHRSGRTGRAGKSGTSITITHSREARKIRDIEHKFGIEFIKEKVPSGKDICQKQLFALIDKIEKVQVDDTQIGPFLHTIYEKLAWLSREELIKHFVSAEFNRFLEYYKNRGDINVSEIQRGKGNERRRKNEKGGRKDKVDNRDSRGRVDNSRPTFTRLFINAGSKNKLNPGRLLGMINEALNSGDAEVGKIEIMKKFSFFEIEKLLAEPLMGALQGKNIDGVSLEVEVSKERPPGLKPAKRRSSRQKGYAHSKENKKRDRRGGGSGRRKRFK